jgi:hypothetical protein
LFFSFKADYDTHLNEESDGNIKHAKESGLIFLKFLFNSFFEGAEVNHETSHPLYFVSGKESEAVTFPILNT